MYSAISFSSKTPYYTSFRLSRIFSLNNKHPNIPTRLPVIPITISSSPDCFYFHVSQYPSLSRPTQLVPTTTKSYHKLNLPTPRPYDRAYRIASRPYYRAPQSHQAASNIHPTPTIGFHGHTRPVQSFTEVRLDISHIVSGRQSLSNSSSLSQCSPVVPDAIFFSLASQTQ